MLRKLFPRRNPEERRIADALYGEIVAAARQPAHYSLSDVPDTPLGRFEMIGLHVFLVLRRLRGETGLLAGAGQELADIFFLEVEHSLRELGIGDISVPKRMKKLAKMFYGRVASYGDAIDAGDRAALQAALSRNIRPDQPDWAGSAPLADYVLAAAAQLAATPGDVLLEGRVTFPAPAEHGHAS